MGELNRKERRKSALKGEGYYAELTHKIMIADLRVYTNKDLPDGVMIVSTAEADRLQAIVDEANAKATKEIADRQAEANLEVTIDQVNTMIAEIDNTNGDVNTNDYALYLIEEAVLVEPEADYPLDIKRVPVDYMPKDTIALVGKKEGK